MSDPSSLDQCSDPGYEMRKGKLTCKGCERPAEEIMKQEASSSQTDIAMTSEQMRAWICRAAAVLPLIPRDHGTDLAEEVSWLLRTAVETPQQSSKGEISRFDMINVSKGWDAVYQMVAVPGGEWVRYEEIERLQTQNKNLLDTVASKQEKLEHQEKYWAQFNHYPKGSPDETTEHHCGTPGCIRNDPDHAASEKTAEQPACPHCDGFEIDGQVAHAPKCPTLKSDDRHCLVHPNNPCPAKSDDDVCKCTPDYSDYCEHGLPRRFCTAAHPHICVCGDPAARGVQHRTDGPCIQLNGT